MYTEIVCTDIPRIYTHIYFIFVRSCPFLVYFVLVAARRDRLDGLDVLDGLDGLDSAAAESHFLLQEEMQRCRGAE
jgi:hypothetical protein